MTCLTSDALSRVVSRASGRAEGTPFNPEPRRGALLVQLYTLALVAGLGARRERYEYCNAAAAQRGIIAARVAEPCDGPKHVPVDLYRVLELLYASVHRDRPLAPPSANRNAFAQYRAYQWAADGCVTGDVDADCTCDQWCPHHPEVWASTGCSVPKSVADGGQTEQSSDFVCPAGYTTCESCCDLDSDCACDDTCSSAYPAGVACTLAPGQDEYGLGSPCPDGYTQCGSQCDVDDDCNLDDKCGSPGGFPCTVTARVNGDGSPVPSGEVHVYPGPLSFDLAELSCLEKGGHLMSLHSSEDWHQLHEATIAARVQDGVFVGAYKDGQGRWAWTDSTDIDPAEVAQTAEADGIRSGDAQLAYCSVDCVENRLKPHRVDTGDCGSFDTCCAAGCSGLVSWGRRDDGSTELAYACRLTSRASAVVSTSHGRRMVNECQAQFGCESGADLSQYTCVESACMEVDWDNDGSQHDVDCCGVPEDAYPVHGVYTYCATGYTMVTGGTCDGNGGFDGGGSKYDYY